VLKRLRRWVSGRGLSYIQLVALTTECKALLSKYGRMKAAQVMVKGMRLGEKSKRHLRREEMNCKLVFSLLNKTYLSEAHT